MDTLDDQWDRRDFPVLREIVRNLDTAPDIPGPSITELAAATGLTPTAARAAAHALDDAGLIRMAWVGGGGLQSQALKISAEARRLAGVWPTPETALDRMVTALEAIAASTSDEDTRTRARKLRDALTGAGRDLGMAAARAAITGQIPT